MNLITFNIRLIQENLTAGGDVTNFILLESSGNELNAIDFKYDICGGTTNFLEINENEILEGYNLIGNKILIDNSNVIGHYIKDNEDELNKIIIFLNDNYSYSDLKLKFLIANNSNNANQIDYINIYDIHASKIDIDGYSHMYNFINYLVRD